MAQSSHLVKTGKFVYVSRRLTHQVFQAVRPFQTALEVRASPTVPAGRDHLSRRLAAVQLNQVGLYHL